MSDLAQSAARARRPGAGGGAVPRERGDHAQGARRPIIRISRPAWATSRTCLSLRGDYNGARKRSIAKRLAIYAKSPTSIRTSWSAATWNNLSYALRGQGRLDEAEAAARKALPIVRAARGDNHPDTACVMVNLGRFELERGRPKEAEALIAPALKFRQEAFPPDDRRVAIAMSWLAAAYTAQGRYAEAEPLLLEAHRHLSAIPAAYATTNARY